MSQPHVDLTPHSHDPNPTPPSDDPAFIVRAGEITEVIDPAALRRLPLVRVPDCFVVSTGHGTSGPFTFGGARPGDLLAAFSALPWRYAAVISGDGFATRIERHELETATARPILLAYEIDGRPLTRAQGLVRLIVPSEVDDALRQVKWVAEIRLVGED